MTKNEFYFSSADKKTRIHAVEWLPEGEPKAVLQISHGVTEHILCYEELAEYFTARGFVVTGNDHLGHGTSIAEGAKPMYFGPKDSWLWVQEDMYTCLKFTKERYQNLPYILLGLSLGSFIARSFVIAHPGEVDGVILAGTGQSPAWQLSMVRFLAQREGRKAGEDNVTPLIQQLSFGMYNAKFAPNHTKYDWICAGKQGLDTYIKDPLRGEEMSAGLFREMLSSMIFSGDAKNQKKMDKDLPVLLISGAEDPVGNYGKGVECTCASLCKAGIRDITMKLYPGMRHQIFIEDQHQEVFRDILVWSEERLDQMLYRSAVKQNVKQTVREDSTCSFAV